VRLEPRDTVIDGVPAITFVGFDARVGKELDSWLNEIMSTWRFTK
jgi:hypothetical protein